MHMARWLKQHLRLNPDPPARVFRPQWVRNVLPRYLAIALAFILTAPFVARAQDPLVLEFDPARSRISFAVASFPHVVEGTFKLKRGLIRLDMTSGTADGAVIVDAASGDSGNQWRDSDMRRDILECERYPEIVFAPQSVILRKVDSGDSLVKVQGILTLHGAKHPIELSLSVHENEREVTLSGSFTIPYVAWGLKDPSLLLFRAGKNVEVAISSVARLERPTQ